MNQKVTLKEKIAYALTNLGNIPDADQHVSTDFLHERGRTGSGGLCDLVSDCQDIGWYQRPVRGVCH